MPNARRPTRGRASVAVALLVFSALGAALVPGPAGAYPVFDTAFSDGSTSGGVYFPPASGPLAGPSLRLLANATFDAASVTVEGVSDFANLTAVRTSTSDFSAASVLDNARVSSGSVVLINTTANTTFNAGNSFGGGSSSNTAVVGGRLVLSSGASGTYTTPVLSANAQGWGYLSAYGAEPLFTNITFDLLDGQGAVVFADLQPGARIPFTTWELPSLAVRLTLEVDYGRGAPWIEWFAIGESTADGLVGGHPYRSSTALAFEDGAIRSAPEPATFTKYGGNPLVTRAASTYRSTFVGQPAILKVGSEWWMYFTAASSGNEFQGAGIARAVSSDLTTWTVDAAPLLNSTAATFDAYGVGNAYVMANPAGSGYLMFYNGYTSLTQATIGRASSPDGVTWTKDGQVLSTTSSAWDSILVGMVSRVRYDAVNGTWFMWYSGTDTPVGGGNDLGLATSTNGLSWTKYIGNPVMSRGDPMDVNDAQGGKQIEINNIAYYYYSCNPGGYYSVCLAYSTLGGLAWTKVGPVINRSSSGWDSENIADPTVVLTDSSFFVFYAGYQSGMPHIGRASAPFKAGSVSGRIDLLSGVVPDLVTFTKDSGNPKIANQASTYYSTFIGQPSVIQVGSEWWMYFAAGSGTDFQGAGIARAVSTDLVAWALDAAPLLSPDASLNDSYAAANPYVLSDPLTGGYLMYYGGWSSSTKSRVMRATSADGVTWTKTGEVLRASPAGWDSYSVGMVSRVLYDPAALSWKMWYSGSPTAAGGDNALGYATSADGVNWTKWPLNPVMPNGGLGSADQDDAQGGKVLAFGGLLYYYYSCHNGITYRVCLASSLDGLSWTKFGSVVNRSTSGWDSGAVSDPAPVVGGSSLYLFFVGNAAGRSQIGRATGALNPQAPLSSVLDLPQALVRFTANLSAGTGGSITLQLRSSTDGATWSSPETVTASDSTITTPARRFVEYTAAFSASSTRSALRAVAFFTQSFADTGRYVSDEIAFADPLDGVALVAVVTGSGTADWAVSTDSGATWTNVTLGIPLNVTGDPLSVRVEARLRGYSASSPSLDLLLVAVRARGLPADVILQVGGSGAAIALGAGPFTGPVILDLPVADLNAALSAGLAADPGAPFVDVPLTLTSTHFGLVRLSNPSLSYTLKNPLDAAFDPPLAAVSVDEGASATFTVGASTCCGAPLNYSWWFDGAAVASPGPSYTYSPGFSDAGAHTLMASVENGDFNASMTWDITVVNVNRPPAIVEWLPLADPTGSYREAVNFSVYAVDPDGDALSYTWSVAGISVPTPSNRTAVGNLPAGMHSVSVTASDGSLTASHAWTLTLTNAAPTATFDPAGAVTISHTHVAGFTVTAADADGDAITYAWAVDGNLQLTATGPTFALVRPAVGSHTVSVTVSDGGESLSHSWTVVSTNAAPAITSSLPAGGRGADSAESQTFTVISTDGDGDALVYSWTLNGDPQASASPSLAVPAGLAPGDYTVVVVVTDALGASASSSWIFTVPSPPPATPPAVGAVDPLLLIGLLAAVGAVALALVLMRRRRQGPSP